MRNVLYIKRTPEMVLLQVVYVGVASYVNITSSTSGGELR